MISSGIFLQVCVFFMDYSVFTEGTKKIILTNP
jgi:hypothetical protein